MKYASIKNPDLKSTADLIVLSHERRNIIMLLPSTYQVRFMLLKIIYILTCALLGSIEAGQTAIWAVCK